MLDIFEPLQYCNSTQRKISDKGDLFRGKEIRINSTVITIEPTARQERVMRVAAYCRVSSDSEDQLHSFASQVRYYTNFIGENENMELVDIYADEGITGTKTANRDDFKRLVNDCRKGKIDRVLTKSVSRFARNTADALMYARLLKEYGVSILFEKENIDTAFMSSELLLAMSCAQAQEESVSISKNMRWSIERRMKAGTFRVGHTAYGYRLKNKEYAIDEKEAEIVRLIFRSFLSGMGKKKIADMLNKINAPKRNKNTRWQTSTVGYILTNERYIGDALFQKTYITETLPFRKRPNRGEKAKYYTEGVNAPIISKTDFEAVQRIIREKITHDREKCRLRPLTRKIRCGCGTLYKPLTVNGKNYWGCIKHHFGSEDCDSRRIPEKDIYDAFITMINKLRNCREHILPPAITQTERLQMKTGTSEKKIRELDKETAELCNKNLVLARLHTKGILRPAEYAEQSGIVNSRISELRNERKCIMKELDEDGSLSGLRRLNNILSDMKNSMTEFDGTLFCEIVEEVTIPIDTSICFRLLGGLPITESIPDRRRYGCK